MYSTPHKLKMYQIKLVAHKQQCIDLTADIIHFLSTSTTLALPSSCTNVFFTEQHIRTCVCPWYVFLQRFYFRAGFGFVQDPSNVRNVCTQWKLYFEIYILSPFNLSCILYKKVKLYFFFLEILKSLEKRNICHDNDKSWLHTWHPHCNLL